MDKASLCRELDRYASRYPQEIRKTHQFLELLECEPYCYERRAAMGHITASALVLSADKRSVLLMHHKKLDKWLQPGGHADGEEDLLEVAMKEVFEETGLKELEAVTENILDIDIHNIPQRREVPAHLHYDVRFCFLAGNDAELCKNHESHSVQWVPLSGVDQLTSEESVLRMVRKVTLQSLC